MSIINILVRTFILFVCGIVQVIGVVVEGAARILDQLGKYACFLDDKLSGKVLKKIEKQTK